MWIAGAARTVCLLFGASSWAVCFQRRYSWLAGFAWGAIAAVPYALLAPSGENKIAEWGLAMLLMYAGGWLLRILKLF